jgi:hypothetical protein
MFATARWLPIDANRAHSEVETLCLGKAKSTR